MTAETTYPDCRCGHDRNGHFEDGFAPQCTAPRCECLNYRPAAAEPVKLHPVKDNGASIDQLVAAGKRSSSKRIAALANRIAELAGKLRTALEVERDHAEIARTVARLERELAAAKAMLKTNATVVTSKPPSPPPPVKRDTLGRRIPGERQTEICPECGQSFAKVGVHRARKHGYRRTG